MSRGSMVMVASAVAAVVSCAAEVPARAELFATDKFAAYADFRLRYEADRDSQTAAGVERADRTRSRVRLRAGFRFDPAENWRLELRLRSGAEASQQSPHITILESNENDTGDASFNFDRWYLQYKEDRYFAWAGRNVLPFWKQDEFLFDDDVTMAGVAGGWHTEFESGKLSVFAGYFSPPVGMRASANNMSGLQVAYEPKLGGVQWAAALGAYIFDADPAIDPDVLGLLQGNGTRDYQIIEGSVQAKLDVNERPLVIGADVLHNGENYSPADLPATPAIPGVDEDEKDGWVALATYGALDRAKAWLAGYYYSRIELLAVNNSYAQDDWVRWGSATQTAASNMKGHEVRFGWAFDAKMNVLARLYLVDAITNVEDGNRLRIDFNYAF